RSGTGPRRAAGRRRELPGEEHVRADGMKTLSLLASLLALGLAPGAKVRANDGTPTAATAKKFIEEAEQRYLDLTTKAQRASWVQENFITDDTEEIAAEANQELNT